MHESALSETLTDFRTPSSDSNSTSVIPLDSGGPSSNPPTNLSTRRLHPFTPAALPLYFQLHTQGYVHKTHVFILPSFCSQTSPPSPSIQVLPSILWQPPSFRLLGAQAGWPTSRQPHLDSDPYHLSLLLLCRRCRVGTPDGRGRCRASQVRGCGRCCHPAGNCRLCPGDS